jgi:hypothetical protein
LSFWSARPEVRKIWLSFFTPQVGVETGESLSPSEKLSVVEELTALRRQFPKAYLPDAVLMGYRQPPASPADCIFARTTVNFTADLKSKIKPCQFGGEPDCSQCGCMASVGLNAVGDYRLLKCFLSERSSTPPPRSAELQQVCCICASWRNSHVRDRLAPGGRV